MDLYHSISGPPTAPGIVFLHGFMGSGRDWQGVIDRLNSRYQCVAVDLPGHGRSLATGDAPMTIENAAAALLETLSGINITQSYLVGYSMGGRLALYLSLLFPQNFLGSILESASPGLETEKERAERRRKDAKLAEKIVNTDFNEFLLEWYRQPIFARLNRSPHFEAMLTRRRSNSREMLAKSLREMGTGFQPSLWEKLKSLKLPLLLVTGEFDIKFQRIAARMAVAHPGIRHTVVKNCGHNVHLENRERFSEILDEFISETLKRKNALGE